MSWTAVVALSAGCYVLKAAGALLASRVDAAKAQQWSLELLVVPVLAGLIMVQTFDGGRRLVMDARLPAMLVAATLVYRRAPLLVVVIAAGATAALLRAAGM